MSCNSSSGGISAASSTSMISLMSSGFARSCPADATSLRLIFPFIFSPPWHLTQCFAKSGCNLCLKSSTARASDIHSKARNRILPIMKYFGNMAVKPKDRKVALGCRRKSPSLLPLGLQGLAIDSSLTCHSSSL